MKNEDLEIDIKEFGLEDEDFLGTGDGKEDGEVGNRDDDGDLMEIEASSTGAKMDQVVAEVKEVCHTLIDWYQMSV